MRIFVSNTSASHLPGIKPPIEIACGNSPRTPAEIIESAKTVIAFNEDIECVSEYPVLVALHMIREKELPLSDFELIYCGKNGQQVIRADAEGDMIDRMPGGFFRERGDLLF